MRAPSAHELCAIRCGSTRGPGILNIWQRVGAQRVLRLHHLIGGEGTDGDEALGCAWCAASGECWAVVTSGRDKDQSVLVNGFLGELDEAAKVVDVRVLTLSHARRARTREFHGALGVDASV